jgi:hypothetical protein
MESGSLFQGPSHVAHVATRAGAEPHVDGCRLCKGTRHMFRRQQQGTTRQQQQQQASSMCLSAAAAAAAMYTATEQMHNTVCGMRAYYAQQQHEQQRRQQQQRLQPPSAADLSGVIVAVSRLVQMQYGALHGQGECSLRDQVSKLTVGRAHTAVWFNDGLWSSGAHAALLSFNSDLRTTQRQSGEHVTAACCVGAVYQHILHTQPQVLPFCVVLPCR